MLAQALAMPLLDRSHGTVPMTSSPGTPMSENSVSDRLRDVTILDLDRTLTRRGTYSPFLIHAAMRLSRARLLLVPAVIACMIGYRLGWMTRKRLKERMHRLMLGPRLERGQVARVVASFADHIVADGLHAEVLPLIAEERAAGRTLILATAAHRFYAEALAERLGIEHVVATDSRWKGDILLPYISGENCYGPHKIEAVLSCLRQLGLERSDVDLRCYSDERADLPCFEASDTCFVVNPSRKLGEIAANRGWPVLRFH